MTEFKVVKELSCPDYVDYDTGKTLYSECDASVQCLWVVSFDPEEQEIMEWIERFEICEDKEARAFADGMAHGYKIERSNNE